MKEVCRKCVAYIDVLRKAQAMPEGAQFTPQEGMRSTHYVGCGLLERRWAKWPGHPQGRILGVITPKGIEFMQAQQSSSSKGLRSSREIIREKLGAELASMQRDAGPDSSAADILCDFYFSGEIPQILSAIAKAIYKECPESQGKYGPAAALEDVAAFLKAVDDWGSDWMEANRLRRLNGFHAAPVAWPSPSWQGVARLP